MHSAYFSECSIKGAGFISTLIQTMFLTLTNPMTILTFIAAFAAVGFEGSQHDFHRALLLCCGVFCGSGMWFITLSTVIAHFRSRITPATFTLINKISGLFLIGFGLFFIIAALKKMLA